MEGASRRRRHPRVDVGSPSAEHIVALLHAGAPVATRFGAKYGEALRRSPSIRVLLHPSTTGA